MKECNKWLNCNGKGRVRPELHNWRGNRSEDGFKKGWKAALEWILDNFDGETDMLTLGLRIREEMEFE